MHRFFAESSAIGEKEIQITGTDVNHIRNVLRMRMGEELLVSDGQGRDYHCELERLEEDVVIAKICWVLDGNAELPCEITLYQGLPKGDKIFGLLKKLHWVEER